MKRQELSFIIIALLLGAIIGGLIGDIVGTYLPDGAAKTLFSKSIEIGFKTIDVDFYAIAFTIGLMIKINFMSILVVILVIIYFRWWYL
ncbi:MAG: DUF4321 domain-containing protein [Candidatus Zixiibacteriota bacterium]